MKRSFYFVLLLAGTVFTLNSCKKGENDPFLSLKSRTARLHGEWTLSGGQVTILRGSDTLEDHIYTEGNESVAYNGGTHSDHAYTETLTIEKNGTYRRVYEENGTTTETGYWCWNGRCKEGGLKKKESLSFTVASILDGNGTGSIQTGFSYSRTWILDRLASKEMTVLLDYSSGATGDTLTVVKGSLLYKKN